MGIIIQGSSGNLGDVDANTKAMFVNERPINVGALGSYSVCVQSGIMAAGLAGASPVVAFLWKPATVTTSLALVRKIRFNSWVLGTGFAAGVCTFNWFMARAFTVQDTGGGAVTLTTNNGKMRTAFATTQAAIQASTTATLTPGTRTLDANPFRSLTADVPVTAFNPGQSMIADTEVYRAQPNEWPIVLAGSGEGIVLQATVPATGTWTFSMTIDWDEVLSTEI
jgi:hypothetical protein